MLEHALQYHGVDCNSDTKWKKRKKRLRSTSFSQGRGTESGGVQYSMPMSSAKKRRRRFDLSQINLDLAWRDVWKQLSAGGWKWIIAGHDCTPHFLRPEARPERANLGLIFLHQRKMYCHICVGAEQAQVPEWKLLPITA